MPEYISLKKRHRKHSLATCSREENYAHGSSGWLYPGHALNAWLKVNPRRIVELEVLAEKSKKVAAIVHKARAAGVPVKLVDTRTRSVDTEFVQSGCRAKLGPFPYRSLSSILESSGPGLLVVLDHLLDPRNLGAIARSVLAAGGRGMIVPKDRAASVTPVVEVTAAGACAYLSISRVVNIARAIEEIKDAGYWTVALHPREARSLFAQPLPSRIALVAGGEQGLSRLVLERSDEARTIPMDPRVESLNAAVALGVACFWWAKDHAAPLTV